VRKRIYPTLTSPLIIESDLKEVDLSLIFSAEVFRRFS
jgi:hypothetical protein